jgi:hypothetical protein
MVLKAPSEPSGKQELRARRAAPGPHGTRPPSNSACRCQPSFRFSATGLFHPARLDWPLCFAPALLIALACACIACTRMHAPPTHCSSYALMLHSPAQHFSGSRTRASPPHCSLRARMLLSPPMARVFFLFVWCFTPAGVGLLLLRPKPAGSLELHTVPVLQLCACLSLFISSKLFADRGIELC